MEKSDLKCLINNLINKINEIRRVGKERDDNVSQILREKINDLKENEAKLIKDAKDLKKLFNVLKKIKELPGKQEGYMYSYRELGFLINHIIKIKNSIEVENSDETIFNYIPPTAGLRDKVKEIIMTKKYSITFLNNWFKRQKKKKEKKKKKKT